MVNRTLADFEEWKAKPVTNFMSALGRVEVTIKRADGSMEVIKPFTLKEWEANVHTVEDVIALKKKLEEKV
tara:strand:- start:806 stop:1018 length:213 start_codon:yes stop_codon:yes gene_type:complete